MLDIPELDTLTPEQRRKVLAIAQEVLEVAHQAAHGQRLPVPLLDDLLPPNQRAYCAVAQWHLTQCSQLFPPAR